MRIIRGKYGRRRFDVPTNITARPTTDFARENIFNVIENLVDIEDTSVLDLFAGTGAVSLEFASRGARPVVAVEKAATQYNFIRKTVTALGDENISVVRGDVRRYISAAPRTFDIIFADPPYTLPDFDQIVASILDSKLTHPGTLVIIEHSRDHDYSAHPAFAGHRVYGSVNFSLFQF